MAEIEASNNVKDRRGAKFTKSEADTLIDIVGKYKSTIENKRTDATTWKDKSDAWIRICEEFNAISRNYARSVEILKAKYESIKKIVRKKCATLRIQQSKTGGGVPECRGLDAYEEKVMSMPQLSMLGMSARFDNDNSDPNNMIREQQLEYIEENDVLEFLKNSGEIPQQNTFPDESQNGQETNTNEPVTDDTAYPDAVNSSNISSSPKQSDITTQGAVPKRSAKFIHKRKNIRNMESVSHEESSSLKKDVLQAQKDFLSEERATKTKIYKLMMENLEMDLKIKNEKLRRLQAGRDDENGDAEYSDTSHNHYLDSL